MFGGGSAKGKIKTESNFEVSLVVLSLLKADKGKEIFVSNFEKYAKALVKRLRGFSEKLKKDGIFNIIGEESFSEASFNKQIDEFGLNAENMKIEEVNGIIEIIEKKYLIGDKIMIEGVVLALYEFTKNKLTFYYKIVDLKEKFMSRKKSIDEILKRVPQSAFEKEESLAKIMNISKVKGLKTFNEETMRRDDLQGLIEENKNVLRRYIDPNDSNWIKDFLEKTGKPNEMEKLLQSIESQKKLEKFEKEDTLARLDEDIFGSIESFFFNLNKFKKDIISKETINSLMGDSILSQRIE